MIQVGDQVQHKTGGKICTVVWLGPIEAKVRWKDTWNFPRPNWYDRQTQEAWNYLSIKDLVKVS